MSDYSFERFSILVAEDNSYIRSLLLQSLRAIGVGNVRVAEHGGDAIDILKLMKNDPTKAGLMSVDMILSNWQMSPIDGMMLLRFVRRHKESPYRFIPFVMVTGFADRDKVGLARDLGVTEILAKPFSVTSLARRLIQVIDRPRQFVHTPDFFGPDRRRQNLGPPGDKERRWITEDEVDIIHDD